MVRFFKKFVLFSFSSFLMYAICIICIGLLTQNGLGKKPAMIGEIGCVRELVPIANECGFYWGGHFDKRKDGMHFEIAKIIKTNL